jgi:hypothetical protein
MNAPSDRLTRTLRFVVAAVVGLLVLVAAWYGYAYAVSPLAVRHPESTHYHFRLQVINDGRPVNFADSQFQTPFDKGICTAALPPEPFHFHDGLDQFAHVHWDHATGGDFLKNYGWNFTAGTDRTLGYRFDQLPRPARVPIHGLTLPKPPAEAKYYIYVGNKDGYQQRSWDKFINTDLKDFFAIPSAGAPSTLLGRLVPAALAHEGHDHAAETPAATSDEERLIKIHSVVGNAVIFVQKDPPTDQQIRDRFNQLVPLPESTCGG